MGICASRKKRVESNVDLYEKYQEIENRLLGASEEIQKAMKQLYVVDSKVDSLFAKLEKQQDEPETVYEKAKYVESSCSPFKNDEVKAIKLKGVTKKITKMELTYSERKRKIALQSKLQLARDKLKEVKVPTCSTAIISDTFGFLDTLRSAINTHKSVESADRSQYTAVDTLRSVVSEDRDQYRRSWISTPEGFAKSSKTMHSAKGLNSSRLSTIVTSHFTTDMNEDTTPEKGIKQEHIEDEYEEKFTIECEHDSSSSKRDATTGSPDSNNMDMMLEVPYNDDICSPRLADQMVSEQVALEHN